MSVDDVKHEVCFGNKCHMEAVNRKMAGMPPAAEGKKLLNCVKCRIAKYCSKDCQKSDWNHGHKGDCRYIGKCLEVINYMEQNGVHDLRPLVEAKDFSEPYAIDKIRQPYEDYIHKKLCYFMDLWSIAESRDNYVLYDKCFKLATELMRLSAKETGKHFHEKLYHRLLFYSFFLNFRELKVLCGNGIGKYGSFR